jgi:phosphocarrier protein HPr
MSASPIDQTSSDAAQTAPGVARRVVTICNQRGLHARAAARFVKTAAQFDAEVSVRKNGTEVSGRSIMGLMMLAAAPGTVIELVGTGRQAEAAVTALAELIECKFDEE